MGWPSESVLISFSMRPLQPFTLWALHSIVMLQAIVNYVVGATLISKNGISSTQEPIPRAVNNAGRILRPLFVNAVGFNLGLLLDVEPSQTKNHDHMI